MKGIRSHGLRWRVGGCVVGRLKREVPGEGCNAISVGVILRAEGLGDMEGPVVVVQSRGSSRVVLAL
jgi:hypothetical protein